MKPRIVVVVDWYLPGYKAGGQITAVANLIECVGNTFEFFVFTRDRDSTAKHPYAEIPVDCWVTVGKARVFYTSDLSVRNLRRRIREIEPQIIYLNSFFSVLTIKVLCLRRFGRLPSCAMVLAPRGEFSPGALKLKRLKKWLYRNLAFRGGLFRDLVWQASSELEREHIDITLRTGGLKQPRIQVAWELPSPGWLRMTGGPSKPSKRAGAARFLFLSRVSPMKNLLFALNVFQELTGRVEFDIVGPVGDDTYWEECKKRMAKLPSNVMVTYRGAIPRERVLEAAVGYHFFLLPTLGENFGYAIMEAMAAGCPVVLSDRTPWQDVQEQEAGWCLPLENHQLWQSALQQCMDMDEKTYQTHSLNARHYFEKLVRSNAHREDTVQLFSSALARSMSAQPSDAIAKPAS
jgi:glycosyltransferase involved in cell wall biosynthesis